MSFFNSIMILSTILLFSFYGNSIFGTRNRHIINFQSPDFFPVSFARDPTAKRFIVSSSRRPSLISVSDSGIVTTLVSDRSLPAGSFFPNVMVDPIRQRIIATVHSRSNPSNSALATYQLHSPHRRLFLASLHEPDASVSAPGAAGVAIDFFGSAVITNSASNFIWNVGLEGRHSIFSSCEVYTDHHKPHGPCGLNGIVYNSKGHFLVIQSNTGKLFKVDDENGVAKEIELNINLTEIRAIDIKNDGVVLLMSKYKLYFLNSEDGWNKAKVFDEVRLDAKRSPISVTVGGEVVYVLYGHVEEGMIGNSHRNHFSIVGIGPKAQRDFTWIVYMLIGYGSVYFLKWSSNAQ
ncbi:Six-bladed beta-propeller, TolB-like protein [Cynara cardunculus var. scolymus]|uniref:Six-bladed beta-propeller, TolB-like protein n=2 Tax=Cynara cardunculus var. scolymus TaxID=59895 RepID=A0A103YMC7_CYNCS|nr:Six-bladed beta-propeller, TolB-like protein [Cynara cardunculus var. scolymus]